MEQLIDELANLQGKGEEIVQVADAVKTEQIDLIAKQGQLIAAVNSVAGKLRESQKANEEIEKLVEQARAGKTNQQGRINQILSILRGAPSSQDVSSALERLTQAIADIDGQSGRPVASGLAGGYKRHTTRGEKLIADSSSSRKKRRDKSSRRSKGGRKTITATKKKRGCGC
jgi:hypothetical protein